MSNKKSDEHPKGKPWTENEEPYNTEKKDDKDPEPNRDSWPDPNPD